MQAASHRCPCRPGCGVRRRPAPAADPPGCVGGVRRWRPRFPLTGSGCVFSAGFFERERRGFARRPAAATSPRFTPNVPVFTFKTQSNTSLHSNTSSAVAVFTASFHGFLSRRKEKARTWIVCWSAIQHALRVDLAPTYLPMVRSDAQLRLADQAPPRPEYPEAGGDHERWKDMRRHWVASWGGKLPPADDVDWKGWWRRAGAQHRDLVAAARKRFGCDAAAPSISGSAFAPALAAATSAGAKASDDPAESAAADASIPNAGTTMQAALPSTLPAAVPAAPPAAAPRAAAPLPVLPVAAPSARAAACPVVGSARPTAKLDSASVERRSVSLTAN